MIIERMFKGTKAIQLENENLKAIILPDMGGKIASLFSKEKNFELIFQNKDDVYRKAFLYDNFGSFDASGFDDAFPSINAGTVKIGDREIQYPDHGEIWSGSFSSIIRDEKVELYFKSSILPYSYKKIISLEKEGLFVEYKIENIGADSFPCIWAAHYLVNCEENMELLLPKGTDEVINVIDSSYLGKTGTVHTYPTTLDCNKNKYKLNKIYPKTSKKCEKFYIKNLLSEGNCGIYYPHKNITYKLHFDEEKLPYMGFWVTEGGFRGDYNCALEPANGFYDSIDIAKQENKVYLLEAGAILSFNMEILLI